MGLITFLLIACVTVIRLTFGHTRTTQLINICISLLLTYFGLKFSSHLGWISKSINPISQTLAIVSAIVALLTVQISLDVWERLHKAIIVGGLIFVFFPVLLTKTHAPTIYWPRPSHQAPTLKPSKLPAQNTIVLLLDELSASAAGPVSDALQTEGLHVISRRIDPAGKNTINVIPAMWTGNDYEQSVACGPTQLCSGSKVLDFAKVHATSENIDIVGFYHRYCSIKGLRFCSFEPLPSVSVDTEWACSLPGVKQLTFFGCNRLDSVRPPWIAMRENMQRSLLEAPFWQKGGLLYAHLLVPHPLKGYPSNSLSDEYTENIANGAALVKMVAQKAKLVFGGDFKIIVFSDHPLRTEIWCADKTYVKVGCNVKTEQRSTQVPLIIATPSDNQNPFQNLSSNQNIFDLLY